jgi:hypothetical protein
VKDDGFHALAPDDGARVLLARRATRNLAARLIPVHEFFKPMRQQNDFIAEFWLDRGPLVRVRTGLARTVRGSATIDF